MCTSTRTRSESERSIPHRSSKLVLQSSLKVAAYQGHLAQSLTEKSHQPSTSAKWWLEHPWRATGVERKESQEKRPGEDQPSKRRSSVSQDLQTEGVLVGKHKPKPEAEISKLRWGFTCTAQSSREIFSFFSLYR